MSTSPVFEASSMQSSINKIDKDISDAQDILSSLPRSSPRLPALLSSLAEQRLERYSLSDDERDLETSILQSTHAILLLSGEEGSNVISTFYSLSGSLYLRSHKLEQPSDIDYCVQYLYYLRDQSPEGSNISCNVVKYSLVKALDLRLQLDPGTTMQALEEMSVLCSELLASDISQQDLSTCISHFAGAVDAHVWGSFTQPSQQVMECIHKANMRFPDLHDVSLTLSHVFMLRFYATKSNDDYENAMSSLDKIIASHSPPENPSEYVEEALGLAATLAHGRSSFYGNPEYLEEAIFRRRAHLSTISREDPEHRGVILRLEKLERRRFDEFGLRNCLPELDSSGPEVVDPPSFSDLAASLPKSNDIESPSMTDTDKYRHLDAVSSMDQITDKVAIKELVKYSRLLLASLKQSPDDSVPVSHLITTRLGSFLLHAFKHTYNPEYLNESIDVFRGILNQPRARWIHFRVIQGLILSLCSRLRLSKDRKNLDEIMDLFPIAITSPYANVPDRFHFSCEWTRFARASMHPSTFNAYESAISLMQESLAFAPTLEIQHFRLITMRDNYEKLPLDYASYLINIGQLKQAIEALERGRGLLWSEMRGLHTAIDQILIVDPHLARRFAVVNRDLEALTTSSSPGVWINDGEGDDGKEMDPFGRLIVKQRKLSVERNSLVEEIRSLPGLGSFLMAPSFDTLRCAAAYGPVVIINHSEARSDIIILLYDSPPSLIPTPHNFYDRAKGLRDQLLAARKEGLESREYEDALTSVLKTLYDLIGRPVIRKLHKLNVQEQSRVWWCPTSVFCSLPLHAMGPIRSDGPRKLYFSDLYIPSYTPTLTALIESRKPGSHLFGKPSILLVAQPDESIPGSLEDISLVRRLKTKVTTLISKRATPSAVLKGLNDHRFAHFSCHGILDIGKPFDACFKLYGDERLTLLDIIRSRIPSAEFAFLAACHTAELTEESIADEGLHLAAAVQYSGLRSVVGTMWAMADIDGHVLARSFYGSVFSERWQDVPYHERTAEALRDAVKELRRKRNMTTERWVNFVHYGA